MRTVPPPTALSARLRAGTAEVHAQTEAVPFLVELAAGRVGAPAVAAYLSRLLPVYDALEELAVTWRDDPAVAPLLVPGLERADRLRADLVRLGEPALGDPALGEPAPGASVAAAGYAERVRRTGSGAPAYVAHHYTRYLGDLSGGQVVGAALRSSLGLELSFFAFPGLRGPAVKRAYREALDALPWSPAEQEACVREAGTAFRWNAVLADELAVPSPG